jgi:glycosyltransferase involved in cell wall biosynthesis
MDYEVIVIDDGSTDGTQTVVLEMLKSGNAQKLKLGRPAADGELLIADGGGKTAALLMADVG